MVETETRTAPSRRLALVLTTAAIVLAAAALRLVALDRLPPGLHFDEAVYGLLAEDIRAGARPVFFSAYTGREPLYMYVLAAVFAAVGPSAWAIRLTSALAGIVTVALVFALGRALFGPRAAAGAALAVALGFWPIVVSRNGYPNVLIPPLEAAAAWCLWRGWTSGRRRDWAVGGALSGLVLYTYLAARFWPVFLAVFVAWAAIAEPRRMRRRAGGVAVAMATAALVFAPLGLHFARHPADFWERAGQVLANRQLEGSALWAAYGRNAWETAAGFLGRGDPRWHYNLPGRPIVPGAWGLAFVAGLATCLVRIRQVRHALVPLWLAVLAVPGVLTLELQPAGQRMFGILPAMALACGLGLAALADGAARAARWIRTRARRARPEDGPPAEGARWRALAAVVAAGLLPPGDLGLAGAVPAYRDWTSRPETAHIFNADYAAIQAMARRDVEAGRTVVVLSEHYRHPTVAFGAPGLVERLVWAEPRHAVPVPARGTGEAVYYAPLSYLPEDAPALRWLAAHAAEATRWSVGGRLGEVRPSAAAPPALGGVALPLPAGEDDAGGGDDDEPRPIATDVLRFVLPAGSGDWPVQGESEGGAEGDAVGLGDLVAVRTVDGTYGSHATEGSHVRPAFARNRPAVVAVEWRVLHAPAPGDAPRLVLRLTDAEGRAVAQADAEGYLPAEWRPGDRVVQWFALPIERTTPPGTYHLEIRLVDATGAPLPARAEGPLGVVRLVPEGRIRATEEEVAAAIGRWPPDGDPRAGLALLGADGLPDEPLPPGACFDLGLEWARTGTSDAVPVPGIDDLTVAVEPAAGDGDPETRDAVGYPVAPEHPVAAWRERERLRGRYRVCLPARPGEGDVAVSVGWIDSPGAPRIEVGRVSAAEVD